MDLFLGIISFSINKELDIKYILVSETGKLALRTHKVGISSSYAIAGYTIRLRLNPFGPFARMDTPVGSSLKPTESKLFKK